jgi:hypothetical protein
VRIIGRRGMKEYVQEDLHRLCIVVAGDECHVINRTVIVGKDYCPEYGTNDFRMTVCARDLTCVLFTVQIDFKDFTYFINRIRSQHTIISENKTRCGIFANLEGIYFGSDNFTSWDSLKESHWDVRMLEKDWSDYWDKGNGT